MDGGELSANLELAEGAESGELKKTNKETNKQMKLNENSHFHYRNPELKGGRSH